MTVVGSAEIAITPDDRGFEQQVTSSVGSVAKKAAALFAATFAVGQIKDFAKASIDAASDLAESTSKVGVVFGEASKQIEAFGETSATSVGLAKQEALEAAGTFGNLLTSLGLSQQAAAGMSTEVVQLGADLASFNNLQVPETLEKIRSGLVGEIEPLRSLGINFDAAAVSAKALELGLADANGQISESAKVQARLALIMEQSKNAQGDFARTSDGLANQQRILTAEWKDMQARIGQELLPTMLELVEVGRDRLIPFVERAAKSSVPLFTASFRAAVPLAESMLNVLDASLPALTGFARVIESVPAPLLTAATSMAALHRAIGPLPGLLSNLISTRGLAGLVSAQGAATLGVGLLVTAVSAHAAAREKERLRIAEVTKALEDNTQSVATNLGEITEQRFAKFNEELAAFGANTEQITMLIAAGGSAFDDFTRALSGSDDSLDSTNALAAELENRLRKVRDEIVAGAEDALTNKVATGEMSTAFAQLAIDVGTAADGEVNWVRALQEAEIQQRATAGELARFETQVNLAKDGTDVLSVAFQTAADEADAFRTAIEQVIEPLLAQEQATLNAEQAIVDFAREMKVGREENETQDDFMRRVAGSTLELFEAQLSASTSSRDFAERLLALKARVPEVGTRVDEMVTKMQHAGQEVGPAGRLIAQAFADGIVNGLRDQEGRVRQSADSVARIIDNTVRQGLRIQSPSKKGEEIGRFFAQGIVRGMASTDLSAGIGALEGGMLRVAERLHLTLDVASGGRTQRVHDGPISGRSIRATVFSA